MKHYIKNIFGFACVVLLMACNDDYNGLRHWPEEEQDSTAQKPVVLWIDAAANFPDFANDRSKIVRDLTKAKETGFTDVVVDVRGTTGDVLFQSSVAPQATFMGAWVGGSFQRIERTATWDYLQAFIDEGHELGLRVYASVNTMVGGQVSGIGKNGMLFSDESKRDWASMELTANGIMNTLDINDNGARFFNPLHPGAQQFLFDMLKDLAAYSDLDGIILDRGRYDNLGSDFSDLSREKFEEFLGTNVTNWPEDVVTTEMAVSGSLPQELPLYFQDWLAFRAKVIHDFMEKAREIVKGINPETDFGVYVGAWYSSYYGTGANWASPDYKASQDYRWANDRFNATGYADHMDIILMGSYASPDRIYGTGEWTVQGFTLQAKEKIKGDALVIGGPDIGNGNWATTATDVVNRAIVESVDAAYYAGDGYFLFDMIHLKNKDQWQYVKEGLDNLEDNN